MTLWCDVENLTLSLMQTKALEFQHRHHSTPTTRPVTKSISEQTRPSVVCGHSGFESVDFEGEQSGHLCAQLQLCLHSSDSLGVAGAIIHHEPGRHEED